MTTMITTVRNITFAIFACISISAVSFAQGVVVQTLHQKLSQKQAVTATLLSPIAIASNSDKISSIDASLVSKARFFEVNDHAIEQLRMDDMDLLELTMDLPHQGEVTIGLYRENIFTPDLKIQTTLGKYSAREAQRILCYRGAVIGETKSLVSMTITEGEISGVISIGPDNYNLGKIKDSDTHIVFLESDMALPESFACGALDVEYSDEIKPQTPISTDKTTNCVRIRVEVDSGLNDNLGGVTASLNYVTGLYNEIITLYANDNISINVSEVYVWNGSSPYSGTAGEILNQMSNTSANADITSLVSSQGGGGIAWVGSACFTQFGVNYSGVFGFYNSVPTFSSDVYLVAHEIGHNLNSPHTHACAWNGNNTAIDGCGPEIGIDEGCDAPLPANGGTIMSYCNLVGGVGVNFNLGFGPQPGQRIRDYVDGNSCLGTVCVAIDPTCTDGILNGLEEEIDCGGDCPPCPSDDVVLDLKTFLQGPFDETNNTMFDILRSASLLPLDEPYGSLGYIVPSVSTTPGVLAVTGNDAVVDWILVELRDATDPTLILASQSALLQRDGDIVAADGGNLTFADMGETSFYIALRHRIHFGMRTEDNYDVLGGINVDFTNPTTNLFGVDAMETIGGVRVMYSGDANGDGTINSVDKNGSWQVQNGGPYTYILTTADWNLDGTVNSVDKNDNWRLNNGKGQVLD